MTETANVVIPVSGMTCASCQARVQRTLTQAPGVVDASVNLMTGDATIAYDPSATAPATPLTIALRRSSATSAAVASSRASCSSNAVRSATGSSAP